MRRQVLSASQDTKLWPVGSTGAFEHSFVKGENLLGGLEIKAMGGIKTFIPAMWGQVRSASLDTKLWPVGSNGAFTNSFVKRENLLGGLEIKAMGRIKTLIPAKIGRAHVRNPVTGF